MSVQKTPLLKRKSTWIILAGLIALCLLCAIGTAIYNATPQGKAAATERAQSTALAQAAGPTQEAAKPTLPAKKTSTPTRTPAPTNTPQPTGTSTPVPQPLEFSGSGDDVLAIDKNFDVGIIKLTYTGSSNFIVYTHGADGEKLELLVNTIGNYSGTRPFDFLDNQNTAKISVESSGSWTITIYPLATEYMHICGAGTCTGTGDDVIALVNVEPDTAKITHEGEANFIVRAIGSNGMDLVVNEIGNYSGTVMLDRDVFLIEIMADGNWTMDITAR